MRVSIWQQFSSNHSGGFQIIAQFKTIEEAQNAYNVVYGIIKKVAKWYEDNGLANKDVVYLTAVEAEIADEYDLNNWDLSLDWAEVTANERFGNQGLYLYQNLLLLHDPIETWCGPEPFDELLVKLGGRVEVHNASNGDDILPLIKLICNAPDASKAVEIVNSLKTIQTYWDGSTYPRIAIPNIRPHKGQIKNLEKQIECYDMVIHWSYSHIAEFLPALKSHLETLGCKDFELSIYHKLFDEDEEFN